MILNLVIQFASTNILWSTLVCKIIISSSPSVIPNRTALNYVLTTSPKLDVHTGWKAGMIGYLPKHTWIQTWSMERLYAGGSLLARTIFSTVITIKYKYCSEGFIFPSQFNYYMVLEISVQVKHGEMVGLCVARSHIREVYWNDDWLSRIDAVSGFTKCENKVWKKAKSVEKCKNIFRVMESLFVMQDVVDQIDASVFSIWKKCGIWGFSVGNNLGQTPGTVG